MKKGIIVTLYDDFNYGNKLQNYAVYKLISSRNIDVMNLKNNRHLNYKNKFFIAYSKFILSKTKYFIKKRREFGLKYYSERKNNFKLFSSLIPTSNEYFSYSKLKKFDKFDYCFVGSDQVWNPHMALDDLSLFTGFNNGVKVSISASFGVSELDLATKNRIKKQINKFDYVSVREKSGKEICNELLDKNEPVLLVDPTMMIDREEWEKVIKKPKVKFDFSKKFILVSFLGNIEKGLENQINELAQKNNMEVINLYKKNSEWTACGPSEFLFMEKNASIIFTDSFHSAVFGIIFNTPILVCGRNGTKENMNSRIETLLDKFYLKDRRYNGNVNDEYLKCDYSKSNEILNLEKEKANEFLEMIINDER